MAPAAAPGGLIGLGCWILRRGRLDAWKSLQRDELKALGEPILGRLPSSL